MPIVNTKPGKEKNIVLIILKEIIRIRNVTAWSLICFVGFFLGITSMDLSSYLVPLIVFLVSTFCIMSFTFAINNYYDTETDKENPDRIKKNAIASGRISKQTVVVLNIIFIIVSLIVSLLYRVEVFFFCAYLLFLGWAYSTPPLRTKNRPVLDEYGISLVFSHM